MVKIRINMNEHTKRVLDIVKTKFGLKDDSEAINLMTKQYKDKFLKKTDATER